MPPNAEAVTLSRAFTVNPHVTSPIDGEPVKPRAEGEDIPVVNPTTEQQISRLREADADEVDAAVRSARRAFDRGPWPRMDVNERKGHLLFDPRPSAQECRGTRLARVPEHGTSAAQRARARPAHGAQFEFFAEVASTLHGETYNQTKVT